MSREMKVNATIFLEIKDDETAKETENRYYEYVKKSGEEGIMINTHNIEEE